MTYTLSADFFRELDYVHFSDILFPFTNSQHPQLKLGIDNKGALINRYQGYIDVPFREFFNCWLDLMMKHKETSFSIVPVDLSTTPNDEYCLKVASSVKGERKLVVNAIQNLAFDVCDDNCVDYNGQHIPVIERSEARVEINGKDGGSINVFGSKNVKVKTNSNNKY